MACPGELAVYQRFPGPLATQQGALVGYGGVGPVIGKTSRFLSTIAKLSGLWAGVNPRTSSQNAAPSGVLLAVLGSVTAALDPLSAPSHLRGNCRLMLRRGFAVNSVSAGLVGGALAGLCGVTMLELHCANFQAMHVLVWPTAVVPASAAVGALVGWALRGRST